MATDEEIKNIVLYLFLHKWLSIRYTEANAKLLFDAIKASLYPINLK